MGAHITKIEQHIQRSGEGFERAYSLIRAEAEQKRKAGERWDRVEGRIESLIQGRMRSRWDGLGASRPANMKKEDEWREESPFGLRRYGDEFIRVGHDALEADRKRHPRTPLDKHLGEVAPDPIYYNFLHGVELGLKSYLLQVEAVTLRDLRSRKFGHDLTRLLDEALKHGLCNQCSELTDIHIEAIRHSSSTYAIKDFEYIRIGLVSLPPIDQVAEAAETLIAGLNKFPMRLAQLPG